MDQSVAIIDDELEQARLPVSLDRAVDAAIGKATGGVLRT